MPLRAALAANLFVFGLLGFFAWLHASDPGAYYDAMQEDRALEWASFWSFLTAGGVFAAAAWRAHRAKSTFPWFLWGLALFCIVVAMEEISWGQRVFGLQPAEYFLAENYQQEINFHNIASTGLRMSVFRAIIVGYGVVLPLLALVPVVARGFARLGIVAPPIQLAPAMLALFIVHLEYPWKFTGELIECGLGFAFLFAALSVSTQGSATKHTSTQWRALAIPGLVVALAFATAWWSQSPRPADPEDLALARAETEALRQDLQSLADKKGRAAVTKCGLHKRLYTLVTRRRYAKPLRKGTFAKGGVDGTPETRAEFFLDPWGSAYWVRDRCDDHTGRRVVFVYSFGPNRRRESSRWEILGDDVGAYVLKRDAK